MENEIDCTVLITGASTGIGAATADLLLSRGYRVIGTSRDRSRLETLAMHNQEKFLALDLDVTSDNSVATILERVPPEWQQINVLVNNAGSDIGGRRNFHEGECRDWLNTMEINMNGVIRVTYAILKGMLERNSGDIVTIGSTSGVEPVPSTAAYSASKHGVTGFSESLRKELEETGVRVMQILPGMVRTNFAANRYNDIRKGEQFYDDYGKWMNPEDIANAVLFAIEQPRHVVVSQMVVVPKTVPGGCTN